MLIISIKLTCLLVVNSFVMASLHAKENVLTNFNHDRPKCQLVFGWTEWRPLQYIDEQGTPQGFQIELVKAIAKQINCQVSFIHADWNKLLDDVKNGKIDFISDATKNDVRSEFAHFSDPYRKDSFAIYVLKKEVNKYKSLEINDLKKSQFRLSLNRNFLYGFEIEDWQANQSYNSSISYSDNSKENFKMLLAGEIDGFIEDPYVMAYKFRSKMVADEMATLPVKLTTHTARFMFSKKRVKPELVKKFNAALEMVKQRQEFKISWFEIEEP